MSEALTFVEMIVDKVIILASEHGLLIILLALLGLFSIISAIGQKAYSAIRYLFMIFIAIPCVVVVGLINKSNRKERLKELGEIKAHLKQKPEKWKRMLYLLLWSLFVIALVLIIWFVVKRFVFPFYELNEATKIILSNSSNIT